MKRSNKKGFTIVELVIVIAIIAILAAVLIPTFASLIQKANESNDIQAAKNMNTFLAAANVTGDVKSILDVYDIFEESGYAVENYTPLYAGRSYYYDKQANQIVYVDDETGKILYPTDRKDQLQEDHDWMSLSMTAKREKPAIFTEPTADNKKITATVKNVKEYAYVIDAYKNASIGTALELTIDGTVDMMGAACFIEESKGSIKITGTTNAVIKNMTSNRSVTTSTANASGKESSYNAAAIIAKLNNGHSLTIENVTFENLNVKAIYAGSVAALVGYSDGIITLDKVTIKNSTVIGHRDVGAIVGQGGNTINLKGNVTLDNVNVMTVGGRAALLGRLNNSTKLNITNNAELINNNNSKVSIYESKVSEQKFVDGAPTECPDGWDNEAWNGKKTIEGQERYIYSVKNPEGNGAEKEYSVYGYISDAVIIRGSGDGTEAWASFSKLSDYKTK